ncbi:type VII secretion protein EccB [Nocardioides sp.]|uniref:type VII secretion protein EccB n=1 Tax=Nocardioides sp. TaxID=35761 RepID=UPI00351425AD
MATKKDLVEAYSFNRRRLVTAFVSGAPGGREVEPARPGRMIVGGAALAVLLVAGAAIAGALTRSAPVSFDQPALVTDDRGALYVILDKNDSPGEPTLRPVINVTSAQLILGSEESARRVRDKDLARPKGPAIGILDAPATVPAADQLINSGWTSCTGAGQGLHTVVQTSPAVDAVDRRAFLATSASTGRTYVIAETSAPGRPRAAYRYEAPAGNDALLSAVADATRQDAVTVPDAWLALIPEGGPLDARGLGIAGLGRPAGLPGYAGALVGDLVERDGRSFAITSSGLVRLSPFADRVLRSTSLGPRLPEVLTPAAGAPFDTVGETYASAQWPDEVPRGTVDDGSELCAVLDTGRDEAPSVHLALARDGSDLAESVAAGTSPVEVASGRGALVRVGGFDSASARSVYLVDERGRTYPLAGKQELTNLGYADVPPVVVPDTWNRLFAPGPELSQSAALCPPGSTQGAQGADGAAGGTCS